MHSRTVSTRASTSPAQARRMSSAASAPRSAGTIMSTGRAQGLFLVPAEQLAGGVVPDLDQAALPAAHDGFVAFLGDRSQQVLAVDRSRALGRARATST